MRAVNLLPPVHRHRSNLLVTHSDGGVFVLLGGLAGLLILAVLYAVADHQAATRDVQATRESRAARIAQAHATALAPYSQFASLRTQRVTGITTLADGRIDWARNMRSIASALPANVRLLTFNGTPPAAVSTTPITPAGTAASTAPAVIPGPTVALTGCARDQSQVADVISRLRGIPGVATVSLTSSQKAQSGTTGCGDTHPQFALTIVFEGPGASSGAIGTVGPASTSASTLPPTPVAARPAGTSSATPGATAAPYPPSTGSGATAGRTGSATNAKTARSIR